MRFKSSHSATSAICAEGAVRQQSALQLNALLEAGKRLAAVLPLYIHSLSLHPTTRFASLGVIRTQVRLCIAALSGVGDGDLEALRAQVSQAVRLIHRAPNEATAREIYNAPQVQQALWAWAAAEASIYVRNMTRNAPPDADKQADLVGDAVMGFIREEAKRDGASKLHPFSMARTWEPTRMEDPLGTLRKYLHAWVKKVVQIHYQQRIHEGVSLDTPAGGAGDEDGRSRGEVIEDKRTPNPEAALVDRNDHRSQVAALTATFERQITGLEADIRAFGDKTDGYSVGQRTTLQNRLEAIKEMVAPLLARLQQTSEALSATETNQNLDPQQREREVALLQQNFDATLRDLTAISEAQERAHGKRLTREEESIGSLRRRQQDTQQQEAGGGVVSESQEKIPSYKGKKLLADPLTTARAYARARENAERLLPHVYRSLTFRKNTDLNQKYTSGLVTNWRLLDGIGSQRDLETAVSPDPATRASTNDRALFTTTALRIMMTLRDLYTFDEKHSVIREQETKVPKSTKQRFIALMGQEIEHDPVLRSRAPQLLDLLREFVTGWGFRALWDQIDYHARAAAYEWSRNERINKRWSDLTPDEINTVAGEAGNLLYDNHYRPFAAWSHGDPQQRVTRDLNLTSDERDEIMRQEVGRITEMMRGDRPRGQWAHGEPVESRRFHDPLRATKTRVPANQPAAPNAPTTFTAAHMTPTRRFASAISSNAAIAIKAAKGIVYECH